MVACATADVPVVKSDVRTVLEQGCAGDAQCTASSDMD